MSETSSTGSGPSRCPRQPGPWRPVNASLMTARFVDPSGVRHEASWPEAAREYPLEGCVPVRRFAVRRGRRVAPGWYWSPTAGRLVHYGFGAMRTQVMLLDRDPSVVALSCRPVELAWRGRGGQEVWHAPHLMARLDDGSGLLVDCCGSSGAGRGLARRARHLAAAANAVGWHYRLAGPPPSVVEANVRWLAGYRHPRFGAGWQPQVAEVFARPRPLAEGVALLGDPIAAWPPVYHALWHGALQVALDRPLRELSVAVWAVGAEGRLGR